LHKFIIFAEFYTLYFLKLKKKRDKIGFDKLIVLLFLVIAMCFGFYFLPNKVFGLSIKRVDLLSDLRMNPISLKIDSLRNELNQQDTISVDTVIETEASATMDSYAIVLRDSLYRIMNMDAGADSTGVRIEDNSKGHVGLKHFFDVLHNYKEQKRPVYIAFLGDSFIEGDIFVSDVRKSLQKRFGGRGVGFVAINSIASDFRPNTEIKAKGWTRISALFHKDESYTLPEMFFRADTSEADFDIKLKKSHSLTDTASVFKLFYEKNKGANLTMTINDKDTLSPLLPQTDTLREVVWTNKPFNKVSLRFTNIKELRLLGVALEDQKGIVVDNYSLRGSSGIPLSKMDSAKGRSLNVIRPYDLIVLQYGLNVVQDSIYNYNWYTSKMKKSIQCVRGSFPNADIILMGVSDRAFQENGTFKTMPSVMALLHAQRRAARSEGIPFWNVYGAMGGENSMSKFVDKGWASKDYTHMSFRGGREIAESFIKALLNEKKIYDQMDSIR